MNRNAALSLAFLMTMLVFGTGACSNSDKNEQPVSGETVQTRKSLGYGAIILFDDVIFETMPEQIVVGKSVHYAFKLIPVANYRTLDHPLNRDLAKIGRSLETVPLSITFMVSTEGMNSDSDALLTLLNGSNGTYDTGELKWVGEIGIDTRMCGTAIERRTKCHSLSFITTLEEINSGVVFEVDILFRRAATYHINIMPRYVLERAGVFKDFYLNDIVVKAKH